MSAFIDFLLRLMPWMLPFVFAAGIWKVVRFDRLVRLLHTEHPDEWERQGCPRGFFWMPRNAATRQADRDRLLMNWTANVPASITEIEPLRSEYQRFRRADRAALVACLIFFVVFTIVFGFLITGGFGAAN